MPMDRYWRIAFGVSNPLFPLESLNACSSCSASCSWPRWPSPPPLCHAPPRTVRVFTAAHAYPSAPWPASPGLPVPCAQIMTMPLNLLRTRENCRIRSFDDRHGRELRISVQVGMVFGVRHLPVRCRCMYTLATSDSNEAPPSQAWIDNMPPPQAGEAGRGCRWGRDPGADGAPPILHHCCKANDACVRVRVTLKRCDVGKRAHTERTARIVREHTDCG